MNDSHLASDPTAHGTPISRLLFVADAAVADVDELPLAVRAVIDAAVEVLVVTPTLPGRLAWLADDIDGFRHLADERLDAVLGHMHSIDAEASGWAGRGSVLAPIADAVARFQPDHILLALRSREHANWQEKRLIQHIEERFGLPLTTYAVDPQGHTSGAAGPLLLCYDGSEDAEHAIQRAGELFAGRRAVVLTVRRPVAAMDTVAVLGATGGMVNVVEVERPSADNDGRVAEEGVRIAQQAGLDAEPVSIGSTGHVWETIVGVADRQDATSIVMGSRGLTGLRSILLGSVSNAVVHHADRPTLIVPRPVSDA
jgi:nucleotide-binding universal stress UspA family protein